MLQNETSKLQIKGLPKPINYKSLLHYTTTHNFPKFKMFFENDFLLSRQPPVSVYASIGFKIKVILQRLDTFLKQAIHPNTHCLTPFGCLLKKNMKRAYKQQTKEHSLSPRINMKLHSAHLRHPLSLKLCYHHIVMQF